MWQFEDLKIRLFENLKMCEFENLIPLLPQNLSVA